MVIKILSQFELLEHILNAFLTFIQWRFRHNVLGLFKLLYRNFVNLAKSTLIQVPFLFNCKIIESLLKKSGKYLLIKRKIHILIAKLIRNLLLQDKSVTLPVIGMALIIVKHGRYLLFNFFHP